MTKMHFVRAAKIVRAIREGNWTNEPSNWANPHNDFDTSHYVRAVQTAEAFIVLASEFNPRFDVNRFLVACGFVDAPVKASKRTTKNPHEHWFPRGQA